MKLILTSSFAYFKKDDNGRRMPAPLYTYNGFTERLKKDWITNSNVMFLPATSDDYERNDSVFGCCKKAFEMSGLSVSYMENCDDRNLNLIDNIHEMDVVILSGGHVPTQNTFFKQINLKEKLSDFKGIVLAFSAGSMNCAEMVYAGPELEGEAIDPNYKRWISGLGLTQINIYPHYDRIKNDVLDGLRVMEDITYPDSIGHEFIAMNEGTYIVIENNKQTLYGEAYRIKDGVIEMICKNNMSVIL